MTAIVLKRPIKSSYNGLATANVSGQILSIQFVESSGGWQLFLLADPDEIPTHRRFAILTETMPLPDSNTGWDYLGPAHGAEQAAFAWFAFLEKKAS